MENNFGSVPPPSDPYNIHSSNLARKTARQQRAARFQNLLSMLNQIGRPFIGFRPPPSVFRGPTTGGVQRIPTYRKTPL